MSSSAAPFGLRPIYDERGRARARPYTITTGYASAIYQYSPVLLNSDGTLNIGAANVDLLGSFAGVEYTDANGRRQYSKMWVASQAGTAIIAYVWDDPGTVFEMQANGSLAVASRGDQADVVNPSTGSSVTQLSNTSLNSTLAGAGTQKQMRIINKSYYVDNDWGDTYTIVQVMLARHQYISNKVAI